MPELTANIISVFKLSPLNNFANTYHQTLLSLITKLIGNEIYDPWVGFAQTDTGDLVGVLDRRQLLVKLRLE